MDIEVGEAGWRNEAFAEDQRGKMVVFFHTQQVKQNFESQRQKRPVFKEKIFITKLVPGDNRLKIDRPLRETDLEEFPVEWSRFEQKKAALVVGTPIDAWQVLSDTQKAEFRALNIFTIDQFAGLPDSAGEKIMGFNDLREKARAFLKGAESSALLDQVRAEAEATKQAQDKEMAELRAQIVALTQQTPKRHRRTRAEIAAALQPADQEVL